MSSVANGGIARVKFVLKEALMVRDLAYERTGFGILNHAGSLWTNKVFETAEEAQSYIDEYQARNQHANLGCHKPVRVRCVVTVIE